MKVCITHAMKKEQSNLRILLATDAYGMGTDAPDVRRVVHLGPPSSLECKCLYIKAHINAVNHSQYVLIMDAK